MTLRQACTTAAAALMLAALGSALGLCAADAAARIFLV